MQCLRFWFTFWLFAISVNNSVCSPVGILIVDNKNVSDLNIAESNQDDTVVSERDNEVGFLRKSDEKGADAYQHFESFHDKDGDAYGYEKHEAYGKSNKDESLNDEKDKSEGSHYNYVQELGDKAKYQKYHGSNDDPGKNKQNNYHYSYNSDDDVETKPNYSSKYSEEAKKEESDDDGDDDEEQNDDVTDEEKSTHFSYKILSDDYAEEDANGDVSSKGNKNGNGYHFGHNDRNTDVDYNVKRSDYRAGNDEDDEDENGEDEDSSEEENEVGVSGKNQQIKENEGKGKNSNTYNTYTVYSSQEGDDEDDEDEDEVNDQKTLPKYVRYENVHKTKDNGQKIEEDDYDEEDKDGNTGRIKDAVELHQPTIPRPTKPAVLVKEHRVAYEVFDDVPKSKPSKAPVVVHSSQPIVNVQQHYAGYHVEDSDGDKGSDDSGKSNGGGGGGSGGDDAKGGDEGGDDSGKSGNLVLAQPENSNIKADENDNGTYKVNINYGNKNGLKKKIYRKRKGNLKKKRIIKPHKYEVEEYVENDEVKKQPLVAGKEASPSHHRDSEDYSNGQQFIYASEADSDAYYW